MIVSFAFDMLPSRVVSGRHDLLGPGGAGEQAALVRIDLGGDSAGDHTIWVVYPTAKLVLPKVRMFIAELESTLRWQ